MFASITQVQSHYSLYSFWTRLKWFKITQFLVLFEKLQTTVVEDQTWGLTWTNEQIWNHCGFYMEKIANLLWVSTSFLSSYFCNRLFCDTQCCETSICRDLYQLKLVCETSISCCRSRWITCTNSMKLSAFTSLPSTSCTGKQSFKLLFNR